MWISFHIINRKRWPPHVMHNAEWLHNVERRRKNRSEVQCWDLKNKSYCLPFVMDAKELICHRSEKKITKWSKCIAFRFRFPFDFFPYSLSRSHSLSFCVLINEIPVGISHSKPKLSLSFQVSSLQYAWLHSCCFFYLFISVCPLCPSCCCSLNSYSSFGTVHIQSKQHGNK